MKKIYYLFLILPVLSYSQEKFSFKNGGGVVENGKKISPTEIREKFSHRQDLIETYDIGRNKKTFGNIMLYGGIGTVLYGLIDDQYFRKTKLDSRGYPYVAENNPVGFYVVGGILIVSAIPIKIGFSKKIRKAVELMNQEIITQKKTTFVESTSFIANSNGVGISLNF
jgi:hypothetical protein